MDHPCYNCKASIPEGIPFCPSCGAPQIRVVSPEQENAPALPSDPSPAPNPSQGWTTGSLAYPASPNAIRWDLAWKGALMTGVAAGLLSTLPVISLGCCLWLLGAGALSVSLYQRQVPGTVITTGMGLKVGGLAGLFAFLLNAIVSTFSFLVFHAADFRQQMQEQMQKALQRNPDPEVQRMAQQLMDKLNTPEGAATLFVLMLVVVGIAFLLFTSAGGALGASMSSRRRDFR